MLMLGLSNMRDAADETSEAPSPLATDHGPWRAVSYPALNTLLVFFILNVVLQPLTDADFGWHLRAGLDLLRNGGAVPATDPYSHTMPDWRWVDHSWLTDGLLGFLYSALGEGGLAAIIVLFAALAAGAVSVAAATSGVGVTVKLLAMAASLWVTRPFLGARTQMISCFALALLWWLVCRYAGGRTRIIWAIPPLFLLWANLHPGFLAGLALLGVVLAGSVGLRIMADRGHPWIRRLDEPVLSWAQIRFLSWCTALAAGLTFMNPYGWRLHEEVVLTLSNPYAMRNVLEWKSFSLADPTGARFAWHLGLLGAGMAVAYRRLEPIRLAVLAVFFVASLLHWYYMRLFLTLSVAIWADVFWALAERALRYCPTMLAFPKRWLLSLTVGGAIVMGFLGPGHLQRVALSAFEPQQFFKETWYPMEAVLWIRHNQHLVGTRMLNDFDYGGFLIWWLPDTKVFLDGRMPYWQFEERNPFVDYLALSKPGAARSILDKYHVDWALLRQGGWAHKAISEQSDWHVVYQDRKAVVCVKNKS